MGDIADAMINGELCAGCGVYLEPGEQVYMQADPNKSVTMPVDGEGAGFPVVCESCRDNEV